MMKDSEQFLLINERLSKCRELYADEKLLTSLIGGYDLQKHNEYYPNPLRRCDVMSRLGWSRTKVIRNIASLIEKGFAHRTPRDFDNYDQSDNDQLQLTPRGTALYTKKDGETVFVVWHNIASSMLFDQRISSVSKLLLSLAYSFESKGGTLYMASQTIATNFDVLERTIGRIIDRLKKDGWIDSDRGSSTKRLTRKSIDLIERGDDELNRIYNFDLPDASKYQGRESNFKKAARFINMNWYNENWENAA